MFDYNQLKIYIDVNGISEETVAEFCKIDRADLELILVGERECKLEEYTSICLFLELPFETFINYNK